jgi:hypothetical protein
MTADEVTARLTAAADRAAAEKARTDAKYSAQAERAAALARRLAEGLEPLERWSTRNGLTHLQLSRPSRLPGPVPAVRVDVSVVAGSLDYHGEVVVVAEEGRPLAVRCDGMDFEPDHPSLAAMLLDRLTPKLEPAVTGRRTQDEPF